MTGEAASALVAALGVAGLLLVAFDFLLTTIGATAHALLSHRMARLAWDGFRTLLPDTAASRIVIGPLVMCAVAFLWIGGTSLFWAMIFQASERAAVQIEGGAPAGWWLDFAFVGHMLSTLGGALAEPGSTFWSVTAVLAAVNGMVILTLSVSFVLTTTQTVAEGRAFLAQAEMYFARRDRGEGARDSLLAALAQLTARLNAVPFALYYSSPRTRRRLPEGLVQVLETAAEHGEADFLRLAKLPLADLPHFRGESGIPDEEFTRQLRDWSRGYRFRRHQTSAGGR